jgi:BON domain
MKKLLFLILITALTIAFTGCNSATNTNNTKNNSVNATPINVAPTVNANANSNRWNSKISKEEYEKNRAEYEKGKRGDTWGQSLEDSWLWFKVRSALTATSDIRESTINVDVAKDVVTLKGTVADEAQKKKAAEVAKVDGVSAVKNELKVDPKATNSLTLSTTDSDKPAPKQKK